jgi:hypothetical protein
MGDPVFVNGRAAVHKGSSGKSVAAPDVCLCPPGPPAGPIPTPLVNTVVAADMDGGATTVLVEGNPQGTRQSFFRKSTGNEVARATGGGVLTGVVQGQAKFRFGYSRNVYIEGEPAVRHLDPLTHNHAGFSGNTPPAPFVSVMDPDVPRMPPRSAVRDLAKGPDWIGVEFTDESGRPLVFARLEFTLPDGAVEAATVLGDGTVEVRGIPKGTCAVRCIDFADARRRRSARDPAPATARGQQPAAAPVKRNTMSKGVNLGTGRTHRLAVTPETQDITLELASSDGIAVPEAEFLITFVSGEERRGRLDRNGRVTIPSAPPGAYSVSYPDAADIRTKVLAGRVSKGLKEASSEFVLGAMAEAGNELPEVAVAFDRFFASGTPLATAVRSLVAGSPEEIVAEHFLGVAHLASQSVAVGWTEADSASPTEANPGERLV